MKYTTWHTLGHLLGVLATAALLTACSDAALIGPDQGSTPSAQLLPDAAANQDWGALVPALDLNGCENLQVPAGNALALRLYAEGVQSYRWSGSAWVFVAPSAMLYADPEGRGTVGTHYAGPTWRSNSGSAVVGTVLERCTPQPDAIPWLLLQAVSADGPGVFQDISFVLRVNTAAGKAPHDPGSFTGEVIEVPYTAEYLFYRAK